mmetsp:Transcript_11717/g.23335  ORF Transcript_11717/g.23335 Transcript_11717/m.23335 type:complete len:166 (+) Transcript_11717:109-606(+)
MRLIAVVFTLSSYCNCVGGLVIPKLSKSGNSIRLHASEEIINEDIGTRRSILYKTASACCVAFISTPAIAVEFTGQRASDIKEPSISYKDFLTKLSAGEVTFVKFLAPDGDIAYATFKAPEGESAAPPIRIGEGYPVEKHDGWSSPAFAIRSVKDKGVPYKFVFQ